MSINRLALRLATVLALRGCTDAGDRVWDSRIGEIDELVTDDPAPFILVYVDDEDASGDGQALRKGQRLVTLSIEMALGTVERASGGFQLMMPETDAHLELALDALECQVMDALQDVPSPARDAWAGLVTGIDNVRIRRGAWNEADKARRFAARLVEMQVRIPRDPLPNGQATPLVEAVLRLLDSEPDMQEIGQALRALAERQPGHTLQGRLTALIGASRAQAEALLLKPGLPDGQTFAPDSPPPDAQPVPPGGGA